MNTEMEEIQRKIAEIHDSFDPIEQRRSIICIEMDTENSHIMFLNSEKIQMNDILVILDKFLEKEQILYFFANVCKQMQHDWRQKHGETK